MKKLPAPTNIPPELQELDKLRIGIRKHEENLKVMRKDANRLDEMMINLDDVMAKHHRSQGSSKAGEEEKRETEENIKEQRSSAAGIILEFKARYPEMASDLSMFRDTVGIVATLATVDNDHLSRMLSKYLGKEKMLGVVCRTFGSGVKNMEKYNKFPGSSISMINPSKGVHGFATSLGMRLHGRFLVICLEELIPFQGGLLDNDLQRRLDLPAPTMPNGETPSGFLGFAVNLLHMENRDLCYITFDGYGLRETLFYTLFSQLQVYKTKADLRNAFPCITHGAVSLDGGMVQEPGIFTLGHEEDVAVKFPVVPPVGDRNSFPAAYTEAESMMRRAMWDQLHLASNIRREQLLLGGLKTKLARRY